MKNIVGGSIEPKKDFSFLESTSIQGKDNATFTESKMLLLDVSIEAKVKNDSTSGEERNISMHWRGIAEVDNVVERILRNTFEGETNFGYPIARFTIDVKDNNLENRIFVGLGQFVVKGENLSIVYEVYERHIQSDLSQLTKTRLSINGVTV
ncbi:uncharacterized protein N7446_010734 [Penicillium canescens]|uniref:Uncharacterized protein n=1 Tax=Penicillium canescens TaxID=5083 RepID=A0AAD6IB44_PENCN|nr:uncharacterized protein N7446_010734 [Penicillium canescens]KAJ6041378.1 hypothetical protein N7460_006768 [Penicillium canescens]KAJ6050625.1 hypothetical protein N7446_010734 [Penicillium canescens]KAJ6065848.1 hypothetical protein N7444_001501 [Penicillium canescens]